LIALSEHSNISLIIYLSIAIFRWLLYQNIAIFCWLLYLSIAIVRWLLYLSIAIVRWLFHCCLISLWSVLLDNNHIQYNWCIANPLSTCYSRIMLFPV
jgi:hypothetical protein